MGRNLWLHRRNDATYWQDKLQIVFLLHTGYFGDVLGARKTPHFFLHVNVKEAAIAREERDPVHFQGKADNLKLLASGLRACVRCFATTA